MDYGKAALALLRSNSLTDAWAAVRDGRRLKTSKTLRQVTSRTGISSIKSGSHLQAGWRCRQFSHIQLSAVQVYIWNGYAKGSSTENGQELGSGDSVTVSLSLEYPRGTFTRLTWDNGAATKVIADNAIAGTDVVQLPFTIPAYAWFRIAGFMQYGPNGRVVSISHSNAIDRAWGDEWNSNTSGIADLTMVSTPYTGTGGQSQGYIPPLVLGYSDRTVWAGVGTSIVMGVEDRFQDSAGGRGLFGRSMARFGPYLNYGCPGDRASYAISNYSKRLSLLQLGGMDRAFLEYGVNDLSVGRTSAQLLADRATMRAVLGVPCYDTTIMPNTNSSDAYATAANQTAKVAGAETNRLAFNQALRAGGTTSAGLLDLAGIVETSITSERAPVQDGGVWLPQYMQGGDGLHPPTQTLQALVPAIDGVLLSVS